MPIITKAGGGEEPFDKEKIYRSLLHVGTSLPLAKSLVEKAMMCSTMSTTSEIHECILGLLKETNHALSFRYNLKESLAQLGPTGYPFEKFIAHIYTRIGFTTQTGVYMKGLCVQHEVDVYGEKEDERLFMECKFRNEPHSKVDVRVPLYVKARFDDIVDGYTHPEHFKFVKVIATNAKFTKDAITYADCKNIHLLGWSYPGTNNLNTLIDEFLLYPVTALTTLDFDQQKLLVNHGIVLAQELLYKKSALDLIGLSQGEKETLLQDIEELISWKRTK